MEEGLTQYGSQVVLMDSQIRDGRLTPCGSRVLPGPKMRGGTYPIWIMGPSGPTGRPLLTAHIHEKNLTISVLMLKMCRTKVPLRKQMSSGIPEPPADGR